MVKLTVELIEQAAQYTNPVRDRELNLRGVSMATGDFCDCVEFGLHIYVIVTCFGSYVC